MLDIFIGYDSREQDAYDVCRYSIAARTKQAVGCHSLEHRDLRRKGLFARPWNLDASGQWWDGVDGRPFSTEFSHSRFLVPHFARRIGSTGWVLFCDCDFMFRADVSELFDLADDRYAVMCVQHVHEPEEGVKMDGVQQTRYFRKNWSSLILWNLNHAANGKLDLEAVNAAPGSWLHKFGWLEDDQIGALPEAWNWLEGHSPKTIDPKAVHFTNGGPWMEGYESVAYAQEWRDLNNGRKHPLPRSWGVSNAA